MSDELVDRLAKVLTEGLYDTETTGGWWGRPECEEFGRIGAEALVPLVTEEQAAAWDKGYTAGHSNAMRRMSDEPDAPTSLNPYRP